MSAIVEALNSLLTAIGDIPYDWGNLSIAQSRPTKLFQLVAMWNDQVGREASGEGYTFAKPACFIEMDTTDTQMLLDNTNVLDTVFRFHLIDRQLDAADGTMDQNLQVFTFRDTLKAAIAGFQPDNCSTLFYTDEKQDYQHTSVYHFTVDAKCCFTDTPVENGTIWKDPPTDLELIAGFIESMGGDIEDPQTLYVWKPCVIYVDVVATPDPLVTQTLGNGAVIPRQYALNPDGTLTIPYLTSTGGITILTPFMLDNAEVPLMYYDIMSGTFDPATTVGSFSIGNEISFNASLPMGV